MAALDTNILVRYLVREDAKKLALAKKLIRAALALYKKSNADFSDCMHIALSHIANARPLRTFDRSAAG